MANPNAVFKAQFNIYIRNVRLILKRDNYALIDPVLTRVYQEIDQFREDNPDIDIDKIKINYSLEDLDFSVVESQPFNTSSTDLTNIVISILQKNIKNQQQLNSYYNKREQDSTLKISFNIMYEDQTSEVFTCSEKIPKSEPSQE